MKKLLALTSTLLLLAPLTASAAVIGNLSDVGSFIINFINNVIVPVLFAVAFIVFLWGAFNTFILGATSEEVKDKGKNLMLWGLIGFFVMASVWGLVNVLLGTFQFTNGTGVPLPNAGVQVGR